MNRTKWIILNTLMWIFSIAGTAALLMSILPNEPFGSGTGSILRIIGIALFCGFLIVFKPLLDETKRRKHKDLR